MQQTWISKQSKSSAHIMSLLGFFLVVGYSSYSHDLLAICIGYGLFFLITAWSMLKNMIIFSIIIGIAVAIFPFLAPVALIVMIVFFLMRISFIFKNWRPVLAGLLVYGSGVLMYLYPISLFELAPHNLYSYMPESFWHMGYYKWLESVIMGVIGSSLLHVTLLWLYIYGYNSHNALGIMGGVPLILVALLLPFLKVHTGFDTVFEAAEPGHGMGGHHTADAYTAKAPSGYHTVKTYVRTAPDGIESNNLSAHHTDSAVPKADLQVVKGHVRSNPDGIVENNLSYNGAKAQYLNAEAKPEPIMSKPTEYNFIPSDYSNKESIFRERLDGIPLKSRRLDNKKYLIVACGFFGILLSGIIVGKNYVDAPKSATSSKSYTTSNNQSVNNIPQQSVTKIQTTEKAAPLTQHDCIFVGIELGNKMQQIEKKLEQQLGKPVQIKNTKDNYIYIYSSIEVTVKKDVYGNKEIPGSIVALTLDKSSISTNRDIRVGATGAQVIAAYGSPVITSYNEYDLYEYNYEGRGAIILRFAVLKSNQKVDYIGVRLNQ